MEKVVSFISYYCDDCSRESGIGTVDLAGWHEIRSMDGSTITCHYCPGCWDQRWSKRGNHGEYPRVNEAKAGFYKTWSGERELTADDPQSRPHSA